MLPDEIKGLDSLMTDAVELKFIPAPLTKAQTAELIGIPVGQIVGTMRRVRPVKDVIFEMVEEFVDASERLGKLLSDS